MDRPMTIDRDGLGDEGFISPSLPDDLKDDGVPFDLDDDVEVTLVGDDDNAILEPRRGQNEANDQAAQGDDPDGLGDIENPKIKDRIMRERRLRMDAERSAQAREDRLEQAVLSERKISARAQSESFKMAMDAVDVRLGMAREGMIAADEDGDKRARLTLETQIRELEKIRSGIEQNMAKVPDDAALDRAYQDHVNARRSRVQQPPSRSEDGLRPLNEKAGRWASQNAWMNDPARVSEKAALQAIDQRLVNEGYDPKDDEYFVEMTKRLAKDFPSLGVKTIDGRVLGGAPSRPAARQASAPPVASARSNAPPSANGKTKTQVQLDFSDRRMMRQLGIPLDNKEAVKRYAREKLMRTRSEAAGR